MTRRVEKCGAPATMRVYGGPGADPGKADPGKPMCSRHGQMLAEDAGRTFSYLRPSDPPARCEFWETR